MAEITFLKSIPDDTSDGKSYYAWLETHSNEERSVHWSFTVHNGHISPSTYQQQGLLTPPPYLFLITRQGGSAIVPSFNPADHLYYARITQVDKDHSTFDILPCPQGTSNNICLS